MNHVELLDFKRDHVKRLANQNGAAGEVAALAANNQFLPRPKGKLLQNLMYIMREAGTPIGESSFDAIALPEGMQVDFTDRDSIKAKLHAMIFIEIKTANQRRVKLDFSGFFFAFTESELLAAETLGDRHRVMLCNKITRTSLLTSVPEILSRARSTNWQVSVQL